MAVISREHFQELLFRYKLLVERVADSKILWITSEKEAFSDLYKDRLTNV